LFPAFEGALAIVYRLDFALCDCRKRTLRIAAWKTGNFSIL